MSEDGWFHVTRLPTDDRWSTHLLKKEIADFIGEPAKTAWTEISRFIKEHYDIIPEIMFGGSKYGWEVRYRKSGKTLYTLTPEKGARALKIRTVE